MAQHEGIRISRNRGTEDPNTLHLCISAAHTYIHTCNACSYLSITLYCTGEDTSSSRCSHPRSSSPWMRTRAHARWHRRGRGDIDRYRRSGKQPCLATVDGYLANRLPLFNVYVGMKGGLNSSANTTSKGCRLRNFECLPLRRYEKDGIIWNGCAQ